MFAVPSTQAQFPEDFDAVSLPALPMDWTSTRNTTSTPFWVSSNTFGDTLPNSAFINDPSVATEASLVSPSFFYTSGQLTFRHRYALEAAFDGGVLEISINGGAFQSIVAAGGSFVSGGYNSSTALLGQSWSGSSGGVFITTVVNMPASAVNKNVRLRWRRVTDGSVSGVGWYVDSMQLPVAVDLAATMSDSVDPVAGGTEFSYTINVVNNGPNISTKTLVRDLVPRGTSIKLPDSTVSQGTLSLAIDAVEANFGTLAAGASASATLVMSTANVIADPPVLTVTSPALIARDYRVNRLTYSPDTSFPGISAQLKLVVDGIGNFNDACSVLTNAPQVSGSVAILLNSGLCPLDEAVARVQGAGALGAVVVNPNYSLLQPPSSGIPIAIPTVMMNTYDGSNILNALTSNPVSVTLASLPGQLLNAADATSGGVDSDPTNDVALQITTFLNDDDADGIPNVQDLCPKVKSSNQNDTDSDGIGDVCDTCTDSDNDGAGNPEFVLNTCQLDGCASDAAKIFPGVCGCGVADTNSDGDGAPDCSDSCPLDGSKLTPGVCGCGVRDIDANSNGVLDCLRGPELKARLSQAKTLLAGVSSLPSNPKKAVRQKKLRSDLKKLVLEIKAFVDSAPNDVQLVNTSASIQSLSKSTSTTVSKLIKASTKGFAKSKAAANKAIAAFISSIAN